MPFFGPNGGVCSFLLQDFVYLPHTALSIRLSPMRFLTRMIAVTVLAASAAAGVWAMGSVPQGDPPRLSFQILTGSSAGTYYPIGQMLASIISHPPGVARCEAEGRCGPAGLFAAARASEGSVANLRAVAEGRVESAIAQGDLAADALAGRGEFEKGGPLSNLRAIAALFPETVHVVVPAASTLQTIADLKGKRVSIDVPGSGTHATARAILKAFKIAERRVTLSTDNVETSMQKLVAGELDAFFFVGGAPLGVLEEAARQGQVRLLPVDGKGAETLLGEKEAMQRAVIPEGTYEGLGAVETVSVPAVWVVSQSASPDLVFAITRALWNPDNRPLLDSGHPMGRFIRLDTAQANLPLPLHEGALRFYLGEKVPTLAPWR